MLWPRAYATAHASMTFLFSWASARAIFELLVYERGVGLRADAPSAAGCADRRLAGAMPAGAKLGKIED